MIDTGAKDVLSISPFKTGSCSIRAGHSESTAHGDWDFFGH